MSKERLGHGHGAIGGADDDWKDRALRGGKVKAKPKEPVPGAAILPTTGYVAPVRVR
ncbi:MAG: hypothetical protein MRJ92_06285 [Nitrospira sp.]|nr:hypothetical protein [Nitrospira sp.]